MPFKYVTTRGRKASRCIAARVDPLIHISDIAELAIHSQYSNMFVDTETRQFCIVDRNVFGIEQV